jgi:aspartate/methionine/tyrosine aminotransferase
MKPFAMERWQSTYENRVAYNLSESGVHPLTFGELVEMAGASRSIVGTPLSYGQSNGSDELRELIARLYPGAGEANVVVTNGSADANFVTLWELLEGGGDVAMVLPSYMQAHGLAEMFGARVQEIWLREEEGWQPDPDEIARAVTERTRLVVVTNPNNPTGAVLGSEARDALIRAADRVGAWILADEVYTGAELTGPETRSFWGQYPRVVAVGSLSKAYGLPGLRIGWLVAPADMAERLWARKDYTTISPGALTDRLATLALDPTLRPRLLQRTRAMLHAGLETLTAWARELGVFRFRPPDAGAICFLRYDLPISSEELAERLRVEQDVLVVPGAHFGMEPYIRIGYGLLPADLAAALERAGALVRELAAARSGN